MGCLRGGWCIWYSGTQYKAAKARVDVFLCQEADLIVDPAILFSAAYTGA